jgi:hypothetical protein
VGASGKSDIDDDFSNTSFVATVVVDDVLFDVL